MIREEISILDAVHGDGKGWKNLIVGGFSQGAAMSCMLMLSGEVKGCVGGWWVMSGWMPFRRQIGEAVMVSKTVSENNENDEMGVARRYVRNLLGLEALTGSCSQGVVVSSGGKERVYIQHGRLDQKMLPEWGEQMNTLLKMVACEVEMDVYEMGHWWCEESLAGFASWVRDVLGKSEIS